jgi:hypothetical protein
MRQMRVMVLMNVFKLPVASPQERGEASPGGKPAGSRSYQAHSERENH